MDGITGVHRWNVMNEVDCESSRNVSGLLTSRWTIGDDVMQATLGDTNAPAYISVGSFYNRKPVSTGEVHFREPRSP